MYLVEIRAHVSPTTRIPRSHLWPTSTCPFHLISQRLDMERSVILFKKKQKQKQNLEKKNWVKRREKQSIKAKLAKASVFSPTTKETQHISFFCRLFQLHTIRNT